MAHFFVWRGMDGHEKIQGEKVFGSQSLIQSVWTTFRISLFKGTTKNVSSKKCELVAIPAFKGFWHTFRLHNVSVWVCGGYRSSKKCDPDQAKYLYNGH